MDVVKDNYMALALTQQEGVPQCWGTDSGPRAHLGRGTNPRVGHYRDVSLRNLIALVCSCRERESRTPEVGTPVARF